MSSSSSSSGGAASKGAWNKSPNITPTASSSSTPSAATTPSISAPSTNPPLLHSSSSTSSDVIADLAAAVGDSSLSTPPVNPYVKIFRTGNLVSVSTPTAPSPLVGVVFVFDPQLGVLSLKTSESPPQIVVLNVSNLHNVTLIKSHYASNTSVLPPLDNQKVSAREAKHLEERRAESAKIGKNVTPTAQRMFDAIAKMYPARWEGINIVIMDTITIASPYKSDNVVGKNEKQVERIKLIINSEWNKMGSTNGNSK